ncbi:MAG TPA: hypothetical protein ENJ95_03595 [Bacteroidetes bacterium]|nr:hypothetical protein [Bacteroidota bacterium]
MPESKNLNIVITNYKQTWKYPKAVNIINGETSGASAVLCDSCIEKKAEITHVVEFKDGKVILHPVSENNPPMGNPAWKMENGEWVYHADLDETRKEKEVKVCKSCGHKLPVSYFEKGSENCHIC